ncbi:YscW family type III secretion system pilotin [Vibrio sp. 811]|uniref:YscW family type III secretion system pilotin n=1 Tax=Vibrio TaxID=662 RepID=UPI0021D08756|nr:YscW family type III secretion system pilotin [Vibrio sp. 811]MDW1986208.1 YscW family type III secretion system pilotin [Vibrio sp. 811]
MNNSIWAGFIGLFILSGCSQTVSVNGVDGFDTHSQASVYGWVSVDGYFPPSITSLEVEICKIIDNQCFKSASQSYQGVQLPVQYSFLIAPIQAGEGKMKIIGKLYSNGDLVAEKEKNYLFFEGNKQENLILVPKINR